MANKPERLDIAAARQSGSELRAIHLFDPKRVEIDVGHAA
jgi:hypothetical protein